MAATLNTPQKLVWACCLFMTTICCRDNYRVHNPKTVIQKDDIFHPFCLKPTLYSISYPKHSPITEMAVTSATEQMLHIIKQWITFLPKETFTGCHWPNWKFASALGQ